jgi:hypothetical protein
MALSSFDDVTSVAKMNAVKVLMLNIWHSVLMMMSYILVQDGGCERISWHLAALMM